MEMNPMVYINIKWEKPKYSEDLFLYAIIYQCKDFLKINYLLSYMPSRWFIKNKTKNKTKCKHWQIIIHKNTSHEYFSFLISYSNTYTHVDIHMCVCIYIYIYIYIYEIRKNRIFTGYIFIYDNITLANYHI